MDSILRSVRTAAFVVVVALGGCVAETTLEPTVPTESTNTPAPPGTAPSTSTTTTTVATEVNDGWTFYEIPFGMREGSSYALGDNWLFVWGGAPYGSGELKPDGVLTNLDTAEWFALPNAPIDGRFQSQSVWTGTEFVVFGGHSFDGSYVDGAAFNPDTQQWREIRQAPLLSGAYPSSVWIGGEMFVWLSEADARYAEPPPLGSSQLAAYDPESDSWRSIEAPQRQFLDASLIEVSGDLVLVGGPPVRDITVSGSLAAVWVYTFDEDSGLWLESSEGPTSESVRVFAAGLGLLGVIASDGRVHVWDGETWFWSVAQLREDCWFNLDAAGNDEGLYLKACATYRVVGGDPTLILHSFDYGSTTNPYGSGFLVSEDGALVTITDANPLGDAAQGMANVGVYRDNSSRAAAGLKAGR